MELKRWDGMRKWVRRKMSEVWSRRSPSGCGDAIWPRSGSSTTQRRRRWLICDVIRRGGARVSLPLKGSRARSNGSLLILFVANWSWILLESFYLLKKFGELEVKREEKIRIITISFQLNTPDFVTISYNYSRFYYQYNFPLNDIIYC